MPEPEAQNERRTGSLRFALGGLRLVERRSDGTKSWLEVPHKTPMIILENVGLLEGRGTWSWPRVLLPKGVTLLFSKGNQWTDE